MLEAFFSSPPSCSTCATFLALVTAISKPFQISQCLVERRAPRPSPGTARKLCLSRNLNRSRIQCDPRPHARTQVAGLDVFALGDRRLSLDYTRNQRRRVVDQLVRRK